MQKELIVFILHEIENIPFLSVRFHFKKTLRKIRESILRRKVDYLQGIY